MFCQIAVIVDTLSAMISVKEHRVWTEHKDVPGQVNEQPDKGP